jgi:hypothetical protein
MSRDDNVVRQVDRVHLAIWRGQEDLSVFFIGDHTYDIANTDDRDLTNAAAFEDHKVSGKKMQL